MARKPQDVTDAELAVLQVLWRQGPCTIRQITEELYPECTQAQYATVQKLLERLERNKGFVTRRRRGVVNVYAAKVQRDDLLGRRLESLAEKLCDGSYTPLLTTLVEQRRLAPEEIQTLRELIDRLDNQPPSDR